MLAIQILGGPSSCCAVEMIETCASDSQEDHEEKDCCGDACQCVCCHAVYQISTNTISSEYHSEPITKNHLYTSSYSLKYESGIWHPPRVV